MRKIGLLAGTIAATLAMGVGTSWAVPPGNTAYVHPTAGFDSGTCGAATSACATLNQALANVGSGGSIFIQAGAVFGPVYITQQVSITGPSDNSAVILWSSTLPGCVGGAAGSCNGSANATVAVEINAATTDVIKLKNVIINNGQGTNGALKVDNAFGLAMNGVVLRGGSGTITQMALITPGGGSQFQLFVNRSDIAFSGSGGGIRVAPTGATPTRVHINNSEIHNAVFGVQIDSSGLTGSADIAVAIDSTEFFSFNNSSVSISAPGANAARGSLARSTVLNTGGSAVKVNGANATTVLYENVISGNATGVNLTNSGVGVSLVNNQIFGNGVNCAVNSVSTACSSALVSQPLN